ncbi:MAG: hypothetical protein IPM29_08630 [Planctomycetes bacterium]|nr:hypothetical protein [Planctomycetota bacterium]
MLFATALVAAAQSPPAAPTATDYVVLASFAADDPYDAAARRLAERYAAPLLRFDPADLRALRAELAARQPRYAALVVRPDQLDFDLARRVLQISTELDADPFVDVSFGYVTGRTAADALAFVDATLARSGARQPSRVAVVAGGVDTSTTTRRPLVFRRHRIDARQVYCSGGHGADAGHDRELLATELPALAGVDALTFVGHGLPREVAGGPDWRDLVGRRLDGAIVLNVACYTGVTSAYWEDDPRAGLRRRATVPPAESFCLELLRCGVAGYTAYLCPRPAGPELDTDLAALLVGGATLGDARRRDYDKTVLGFLGYGRRRLELAPLTDSSTLQASRDAVFDIMLEGATGGVLFGDPALQPFVPRPDEAPVRITVTPDEGGLRVAADCPQHLVFLHCSDPTARFGNEMAMRVYARVPLGAALVRDVSVDHCRMGRAELPTRVVWAVEDDCDERGAPARYLQLKIMFPRELRAIGPLAAEVLVATTADPELARTCGGHVVRIPQASSDLRAREPEPFMLELAAERGVPEAALRAALDASAALLGVDGVPADAMARFRALGNDGFRAACVLLEAGHSHYRSDELLAATWQPGDERLLIELAQGEPLPNFASWSVLRGLAVADTDEVRELLLGKLDSDDAGLFMSAAEGLARLGERRAVGPLAARLLQFRPDHAGVETYLVTALGRLGGEAARSALGRYAGDERARASAAARRALDGMR